MMLAAELALAKVDVAVVERRPDPVLAGSRAGGLLTRNLSAERPIAILSGNSIEHLTLALAAMWVGIPYCPVSPSYSLVSGDLVRLRYVMDLLTPGLIAAFETSRFTRALSSLSAFTSASECSGEWWIWETSITEVTPASSWASEPKSALM